MRITPAFEVGFRARVLQECFTSALPAVWERRAEAWEAARPRPDDFNGRATRAELVDRDERCKRIAEACRRHAQILREPEPMPLAAEVVEVLLEAA